MAWPSALPGATSKTTTWMPGAPEWRPDTKFVVRSGGVRVRARRIMAGEGPALKFVGSHAGTADPKTVKPQVWNERMPTVEGIEIVGDHANADAIEGNERSPYHDKFALDRIEEALREENATLRASPLLPRAERADNMLYAILAGLALVIALVSGGLLRSARRTNRQGEAIP